MKTQIIYCLLISLLLLLIGACEQNPTEPELITENEKQKIPFEKLSGKIAFRRLLDDQPDIYYFMLLEADQEDLQGIAFLENDVPTNLTISPDGYNILYSFLNYLGGDGYFRWQLYIMNIASLGIIKLSDSYYDDSYGSWSPDGNQIAFWSNRNSQSSIWLTDFEQDTMYHLINVSEVARTRPAWYRDGENLLISNTDSTGRSVLLKFEISTKNSEVVLRSDLQFDEVLFKHPQISPTGTYASFVKAYANTIEEIWTLNLINFETKQLTTDHSDWHPAWSPDGNLILFSRGKHLYVMNDDGSDITQITSGKHTNEFPSWVP